MNPRAEGFEGFSLISRIARARVTGEYVKAFEAFGTAVTEVIGP